jgi:hypothetical protein
MKEWRGWCGMTRSDERKKERRKKEGVERRKRQKKKRSGVKVKKEEVEWEWEWECGQKGAERTKKQQQEGKANFVVRPVGNFLQFTPLFPRNNQITGRN